MKKANLKIVSKTNIQVMKSPQKKTWLLVRDVVQSLLKHNDSCSFWEVRRIMNHAGVACRHDLIPASLFGHKNGKGLWIDCEFRRIYKN